jgi:hypothetical protein
MPFAPVGLRLMTGLSPLVVGGGWIGFGFSDSAIQQVRHLDWLVETRLSRVNRRGEIVSMLGVKRRRIGSIEGNRIKPFDHRVSGRPAFYRVDISFARLGTGEILGEYSDYSRVVRPRVDLRVEIEREVVEPGEIASAILVNEGTVTIEASSYDYGFVVQAFDGGKWVAVADTSHPRLVPMRMQILSAGGQVKNCLRYLVPLDQPPGLYRFAGPTPAGSVITAEFEVKARL